MSEHREPIPSMIYNAAVGGHVTNSQQIIDENENKEQSQINAEVKQTLGQGGSVDARIDQAKTDIIGGASSNGNTLKKIEDRVSPLESAIGTGGSVDSRISAAVATETTRAQGAEEQLRQAYEALSQSQPIPVTSLPATGEAGKIYRLAGTTSYADYMYAEGALTTPIKMAEYDNAIDNEPTDGSDNLVKSGGISDAIIKAGVVLDISDGEVHQVMTSSDVDNPNGTRLRILYKVNKGAMISASCGLGQGVAGAIYDTKQEALKASANFIQTFYYTDYATKINGIANYDGYLVISLCKSDETSFTLAEKESYLSATYVSIINGGDKKLLDLVADSININSIEGKGLTIIPRIVKLKSGHTYKIDIPSNWVLTGTSEDESKTKFGLDKHNGQVPTSVLKKSLLEDVTGSYIYTAEETAFYVLFYRADAGQSVDIHLYEITDSKKDINSVLDDNENYYDYDAQIGFIGGNETYHTGARLYVKPETEYNFVVDNPNYPIPTSISGGVIFEIKEYDANETLIKKDIEILYGGTVPDSGSFTTAANCIYIKIGGRTTFGTIVHVKIKEKNNSSELDLTKTLADARVYRVPTGETSPKLTGNRIRLIFNIDYVPATVSASCSLGRGIAVQINDTLMNALNAGALGRKQSIQQDYISSFANKQITQKGYLVASLAKSDNTDFSDAEITQYLAATSVNISAIIRDEEEKEKYLRDKEGSTVLGLNKDMDEPLASISAYNFYYGGAADYDLPPTRKENFSIGVISDIHGTPESIERFVEYMNSKKDYFDYNVCLGDIVQRDTVDSADWFNDAIAKSLNPFLHVVGNHDVGQTGLSSISESTARDRYYQTIEDKGWLLEDDFMGDNKCSWYKDNATYKIRVIGLFEFGSCETLSTDAPFTNSRRWYDSETLQWFANILYSTPSDYSVIVITHLMPTSDYIVENSKFSITEGLVRNNGIFQRLEADGMDGTGAMNNINGNPLPEIVNAFINGTSIEKTYNSITGYFSPQKSATVSKDYSERGEGKFICFINGHVHGSYICNPREYLNQKIICVPSGSFSPFQRGYDDTPADPNNRSIDCFYCIGIDTLMKRVNIAKIGAQVSIDMVKRDFISIPY